MAANNPAKDRARPIPEVVLKAGDPLLLARLACAVEAICRLPAIPVVDWCDRAASAVGHLAPRGIVGVVACSLGAKGVIQTILATGAACVGASIAEVERAAQLGARLERLAGQPWTPATLSSPAGVFIPAQVDGVHQDVWESASSRPVLARHVACGGQTPSLLVYLQTNDPDAHVSLLDAVMPVLMRRVKHTVWPTRTNGWVSPSEHGVLDQLVLGLSVREAAVALNKSPHTVHDHVKSLHRKLGASSRAMLVARALGHPVPIVDVLTDGVHQ
ncbi:MAG: helix-turn-helix transcriptional regulator [Phycisphaerales bacterium]|nr:helix-turn-helix transcriptional regulator [Phycisphaerales bacterium]